MPTPDLLALTLHATLCMSDICSEHTVPITPDVPPAVVVPGDPDHHEVAFNFATREGKGQVWSDLVLSAPDDGEPSRARVVVAPGVESTVTQHVGSGQDVIIRFRLEADTPVAP